MGRFRTLEIISTKFLGVTALATIALVVGVYALVLREHWADVDKLAKFSDAVFKTVALLLGTLWAINRYFVERTDAPQFRVDADVSLIRGGTPKQPALLIFRLDLVNTGKTQIGTFDHFVQIDVATANDSGIELHQIYRWPNAGSHKGGPIEPGSWSAINDEIICPSSTKAVRVFLAVSLNENDQWTWHRTFDVSEKTK